MGRPEITVLFPAVRYFIVSVIIQRITGKNRRYYFSPLREVWQKGGQYYYFDRLGASQLMRGPIYLIPDNMTVRALLSDDLGLMTSGKWRMTGVCRTFLVQKC